MLIQIITVDRSKRPPAELQDLAVRLRTRGHDVVIHRAVAAEAYAGRSRDIDEVVDAIWESDRTCFRYAKEHGAPYTLVLEDDCELDDLEALDLADRFVREHLDEVDLFLLGTSPNCWWRPTPDPHIVRYSHAFWWHAVIFTRSFIDRYDVPRTWRQANDIHFARRMGIRRGLRAYGLRRQIAFQKDRRSRLGEGVMTAFPWGDGRWVLVAAGVVLALWLWLRR